MNFKLLLATILVLTIIVVNTSLIYVGVNNFLSYYEDEPSGTTWADAYRITAYMNETHLVVIASTREEIPDVGSESLISRGLNFFIDTDNDLTTGAYINSPSIYMGAEYIVYGAIIEKQDNVYKYVSLSIYNATGQRINIIKNTTWLTYNKTSLTISIPLNILNIGQNSYIRIYIPKFLSRYIDNIYKINSITLQKVSNITIDGKDNDWRDITPIITDIDPRKEPDSVQKFNFTRLYMGINNESLFFGVKFAESMNDSMRDYSYVMQDTYIQIDLNNDGKYYLLLLVGRVFGKTRIYGRNLTSGSSINIRAYSPKYSTGKTDFLEASISKKILGTNFTDSTNITIKVNYEIIYFIDTLGEYDANSIRIILYNNTTYIIKPVRGVYYYRFDIGNYTLNRLTLENTYPWNQSSRSILHLMEYYNNPAPYCKIESNYTIESNYYIIGYIPLKEQYNKTNTIYMNTEGNNTFHYSTKYKETTIT